MPSPLETLVKILKLEREQGYKNSAVIGGLSAFSDGWSKEAHGHARKPEHHALVDELRDLLRKYDHIDSKDERHRTVSHMLDRIMNRAASPSPAPSSAPSAASSPPVPQPEAPPQEAAEPRSQRPPAPEEGARQPQNERGKNRRERGQKRREPQERAQQPPRQQAQPQEREQQSPANRAERRAKQNKEREDRRGSKGKERSRQPSVEKEVSFLPDSEDRGYDGIDVGETGGGRIAAATPTKLDIPVMPRLARPPRRPRPQLDPDAAADALRGLSAAVSTMKGIGPKFAELLSQVNVHTIKDMLYYLPRRYDDYTRLLPIRRLEVETVATVIGTVAQTQIRIGKGGRRDFYLELDDGSATLDILFYGRGQFMMHSLRKGQQIVVSGEVGQYGRRLQMINPEWEPLDSENLHTVGIVPVYPLTEGLSGRKLRTMIKETVDYWVTKLPDYVPEAVLERADLADLGWALRNLHFPESFDHLHHAKRRFVFDQLLMVQLTILANRLAWQSVPAQPILVDDDWLSAFIQLAFPYPLTGAQQRAILDIRGDIAHDIPMNRLLQGDVGSGKTAVAATALALAFAVGKQAALMAPTSILAEQHYRGISRIMEHVPGERRPVVALLTGSISSSEREAIYRGLADGSVDIVIGTHAIIQEGVEFNDLALAIIDEQHRFGVEQRGALRGKGTNPHLLVMTATPIPRTLSLTLYADLDLSIIDEMPPGRQPVRTRLLEPEQRGRAYEFIEGQLEQGRQAFIIYPLVEASEKIDAEAATDAYEKLQQVFNDYKIVLLHGRMKAAEKDAIMAAFSRHEFDVMVTTSVAEVGVDIPNASVIVIEGANRFGLAQLHQFRGRVGRGEHASYCFLLSDTQVSEARERLKALEEITDGFRLAELDWKLRGAGDLVGTRQSGQALVQVAADLTPDLVELAQREARTIYAEDPGLAQAQHRLLAQRVAMLQDERSDVS